MEEKQETLDDIVAELRADASAVMDDLHDDDCWTNVEAGRIYDSLASRIEAAAQRERGKWERERRAYEKLHDCFWDKNAIQSIVRQMLDDADDLRSAYPKESGDLEYFANALIKCAKTAAWNTPGNAAAMRAALLSVRKPIAHRGGDLARYTLPVIDAALKTPPEPAGNAAMMRMALEVLWDVIGQFSNKILDGQEQLVLSDMLIPAKNAYHHALSAPPVNESGNSSAIREAAEKLIKYLPKFLDAIDYYGIDGYYRSCYAKDLKELHGRMDFLKSALAAPPRNCDVGTAADQARRFLDFCHANRTASTSCKKTCPGYNAHTIQRCQAIWAQLPYEKGGAEC